MKNETLVTGAAPPEAVALAATVAGATSTELVGAVSATVKGSTPLATTKLSIV